MKYDERMNIVMSELVVFLGRFTPPKGMSKDAQKETMKSCCDAIVRKLPDDQESVFKHNIGITFRNVLDHHETYAWPRQADFVKHLSFDRSASNKAAETFKVDDVELTARKMNSGKPVNEKYVWRHSLEGVAREVLDGYRKYSVANYIKTYRQDARRRMVEKHGSIVLPYFNRPSYT